ncbi:hypothetical protein AB0B10_06395 [Micromonospora arborensis]|uniref:hypothetical protein n=1 Tax=Micromonospora arborensis TaxID=2116518 RepID=UPI0033F17B46
MTTYSQEAQELPRSYRWIAGVGLLLGPALSVVGTFYWQDDGVQGVDAAVFNVLSSLAWLVGLVGVFRAIEPRTPRYAAIALPLACYGVLGGVAFGLQGMHEELFGVSHGDAVRLLEPYPVAASLLFWIAGPLFPTSLFFLGLVLARIRAVPVAIGGLISLGAVVFPMSRIPREVLVAHAADLLLLLPFLYLGIQMIAGRLRPGTATRSVPTSPTLAGDRAGTW